MKKILERGFVRCIREPRGDFGLEGYILGEIYTYKKVDNGKDIYYLIHPYDGEYSQRSEANMFNNYFEICQTV